ncbi:MAG TPA: FIST N-terminal domain-containing protein [Limnochordia bacterium]|nr:FIST N-terminal domain-containing protein [Limnochordia bacterium]
MQIGIGISQNQDPSAAVYEALEQSLVHGPLPDLTVVFYAGGYDPDTLWRSASGKLAGSPFIGGWVHGIFTGQEVYRLGVAVLSLYGINARTKLVSIDGQKAYDVGQTAGMALIEDETQTGTVMVFPNVRNPRLAALISGVYSRLGPQFQYIGAGTGVQFTEEGCASDGVAAALIRNVHFTYGIGHGWIPFGEPMLVTRTEGNRIWELDGQPAAVRFRTAVNQLEKGNSEMIGSSYQLGIPCGNGEYVIRNIMRIEDEALVCVTAIPSKSMVTLMTTSILALPAIAKRITEEALHQHPAPKFALLFDGVSRESLLKDSFAQESRNIFRTLEGLPAVGVLTFGQIDSSFGVPIFHNSALTVTIGGDRA